MKIRLLTLMTIALVGTTYAQTSYFSQTTGNATYSDGMGSIRLPSGIFVTLAASPSGALELTRFNTNGTLQSKQMVSVDPYVFSSVATVVPANANNILVTGELTDNSIGAQMFFVGKVNLTTNAMSIITKSITYFSYTKGPRAFYSPEGSVYALFPQYENFDINKLDNNLNPLWTKTIECDSVTGKNPGMDCEVVDSSIIIVGKCDSILGWGDVDTSGTLDSFKLFMTQGYTRIYNITKTNDGNLLIAGLHSPYYASGPDSRPLLAKVTLSGHIIWAKIVDEGTGAPAFFRFVDVQVMPDGRIIGFTTQTEAYSDTYFDGALVFNASGDLMSAQKFGNYSYTTGTGILYNLYDAKVYADGILMTGNVVDYNNGGAVKTQMIFCDDNFTQVCDKTPVTVAVTNFDMGSVNTYNSSSVNVGTGISPSMGTPSVFTATSAMAPVVCSITTGVEETNIEGSVYPNPVLQGESVMVEMETSGMYTYVVTDVSGKMVSTQTIVGNRATLSTNELSSGIYLLNVRSNNKTVAVKKLMVK